MTETIHCKADLNLNLNRESFVVKIETLSYFFGRDAEVIFEIIAHAAVLSARVGFDKVGHFLPSFGGQF